MNDLKTLRDKLNGSTSLASGETHESLKQECDAIHAEFELLKAEDERNYMSFGEVEGWRG